MLRLILVPLTSDYVFDYLEYWSSEVKESFDKAGIDIEVLVWPAILKPPMNCFTWSRGQYYSPCILEFIYHEFRDVVGKFLVVGIGYIDAYEKGLNFVFGEADPLTGVASVYTKRLDQRFYGEKLDPTLYAERVVKEIIHETGHLLGLEHCMNRGCVMNFSNSILDVDAKTKCFCDKCSQRLIESYMSNTK